MTASLGDGSIRPVVYLRDVRIVCVNGSLIFVRGSFRISWAGKAKEGDETAGKGSRSTVRGGRVGNLRRSN